jgi:hypothetical protein
MVKVTDLSNLDDILNDPEMQEVYNLTKALAKTILRHFRGREIDEVMVIQASMGAVQASLRAIPEPERTAVIEHEVIGRVVWFEEFLKTIGRPAEGEA